MTKVKLHQTLTFFVKIVFPWRSSFPKNLLSFKRNKCAFLFEILSHATLINKYILQTHRNFYVFRYKTIMPSKITTSGYIFMDTICNIFINSYPHSDKIGLNMYNKKCNVSSYFFQNSIKPCLHKIKRITNHT